MYHFKRTLILLILAVCSFPHWSAGQDDKLKTRPERTNYEETSLYDDVIGFFGELQRRSPLVHLTSFGTTVEGRAMPLVILSDPAVRQAREARIAGKPVVFIMANIHGGEVEGKEAVQVLSRRIALGDLRSLLDKITIIIAPNYNADGNDKINVMNRTAQYGPVAGVGQRENANRLDLNRDYMKLESPEAQALVRLMIEWDPVITVDLHTTNGSYHGYHLTHSIPLNPATDPRITSFNRDVMMPALTKSMLKDHGFRIYYYGNFENWGAPPTEEKKRNWYAFTHQPRIGQNYVGLRNRLTILSEAYSYLSFQRRIEVTEAFVEEIFQFVAKNGQKIVDLEKAADLDAIRRNTFQLGVEYQNVPLPKPVDILVGEVKKVDNPRNNRQMLATVEDKYTPERMQDFGLYAAKRSVTVPRAYLFKREEGTKIAIEKLHQHGINVEELMEPVSVEVEAFAIDSTRKAPRAFQGHQEMTVKGTYKTETVAFPAGSILVRVAQPLGTLAAYLLEPESDDGLVRWNFLDFYCTPGNTMPVYKLHKAISLPTRIVTKP